MAKQIAFKNTGLSELPEGFVIDEPEGLLELPEGFVVDELPADVPKGFVLDRPQEPTDYTPEQTERIEFLQKQLGGRLPLPISTKEFLRERPLLPEGRGRFYTTELLRRNAFSELKGMGFSTEQISSALAFEEGIKPPSKAPQAVGALFATLIAGRFIPGPLDDAAIAARLLRGGAQATAAGLGGVAGKSLQTVADPDAEFNARELAKVFGEEVIYEGATLGLAPIGKKIIGGAKTTLIPGAERLSQKLARAGQRAGVKLKRTLFTKTPLRFLPAQFSENQLVDTIQGIGENSLIGSNTIFQFKRGQVKAAEFLLEGLSDEIVEGASKSSIDDVASLVFDTIEDRGISHSVAARSLYKAVDDVAKGVKVDLTSVRASGLEILRRAEKARGIGMTATSKELLEKLTQRAKWQPVRTANDAYVMNIGSRTLSGNADIMFHERELDLVKKIGSGLVTPKEAAKVLDDFARTLPELPIGEAGPMIVSFETAQDIRSGLLDILRKGESKLTPDPKAVGIVKRLTPQVDRAMETAARGISPQAEQLWRKANTFYKQGKSTFQNKMIKKLMRTLPDNPEVVSKSVFRPNATKSILRVRRAAGQKAFEEIKGAWIEQLVRESATIDPSAIAGIGETAGNKMLRKFNGLGQTALDAAFTKVEQQSVRDAARILGIVQARTGGHSGALRFVQGSALAGIIASPFVPNETASRSIGITGGVILLGPAVLGKLMVKPTFAKLLSEGLKTPVGTQKGVALTARLVRNVMQARKEINEERLRRERELTSFELIRQRPIRKPTLTELRGFGGRGF